MAANNGKDMTEGKHLHVDLPIAHRTVNDTKTILYRNVPYIWSDIFRLAGARKRSPLLCALFEKVHQDDENSTTVVFPWLILKLKHSFKTLTSLNTPQFETLITKLHYD